MRSLKKTALVAGAAAITLATFYTLVIRKWHSRWGATDEELALDLPGDEIVRSPNYNTTRAITIHAEPEQIWPWLVQMGKGRGGLYSYDWLDKVFGVLDKPSSESILPEYQSLEEGDLIPIGKDNTTLDDFYVHRVIPFRALVIGANHPDFRDKVSWAMVLDRKGSNRTRLIMRVRGFFDRSLRGIVSYACLDPAAFVMLRKQMLNVKRLAERTQLEAPSHS